MRTANEEDNIRFSIQVKMMKNDVFDARIRIKRRMQWCLSAKMTNRGVRIAYRSETIEKEVKMGRVRPLTSVTHMWVKAYVHRQNPAYTGQNLCTQSPKNRPVYARIDLRTRKCKLRIQARAYARRSTDRKCPFTFSSIYHPKSILNMFLPLLMCQDRKSVV